MSEDNWADKAMFRAAPMMSQEPKVHLIWMTPDPLGVIAAACRMYEGIPTYSLDDITDEDRINYMRQVQDTHLKAPLEFVKFHFFIEGVDRAFTHQIVRQRTAVYAQESLRFAVKEGLREGSSLPSSVSSNPRIERRWNAALDDIERTYNHLLDEGIPAEDARGLLPHATLTRLHYATDLRALSAHAGNRLCTQAQFHWRTVFNQIANLVDPRLGPLFRPICYEVGHCPFQASFDRGCTIRERADAGKFDEIDDDEWMLDPTAGQVN